MTYNDLIKALVVNKQVVFDEHPGESVETIRMNEEGEAVVVGFTDGESTYCRPDDNCDYSAQMPLPFQNSCEIAENSKGEPRVSIKAYAATNDEAVKGAFESYVTAKRVLKEHETMEGVYNPGDR